MDAFSFGCRYSIFLITTTSQARDFSPHFWADIYWLKLLTGLMQLAAEKKLPLKRQLKLRGKNVD